MTLTLGPDKVVPSPKNISMLMKSIPPIVVEFRLMDRRTFLAMMAVTAAPSEQVVLGVIGSGGRGTR